MNNSFVEQNSNIETSSPNDDVLVRRGKKIFKTEIILIVCTFLSFGLFLLLPLIPSEEARFVFAILLFPITLIIASIISVWLFVVVIKGIKVNNELKKINRPNRGLNNLSWTMIAIYALGFLFGLVSQTLGGSFSRDNGTVPYERIYDMSVGDFKIMCEQKNGEYEDYINSEYVGEDGYRTMASCYVGRGTEDNKTYWLENK